MVVNPSFAAPPRMAIRTVRITIRVSPRQKAIIAARAKDAGMSVSAYMRRAALPGGTLHDERVFEPLLATLDRSTQRACRAIDDAVTFARASNARIARMERDAAVLRERASHWIS